MNEPHDLAPETKWFDMAQASINAIREVDTNTLIMVGGNDWSSAERWIEQSDTLKFLKDPANNLAFEAHVYFDKDASGTYKYSYEEEECYLEKGIDRVKPFVEWIKQNKFHGFIGEYGIPDNDPRWNETLDLFLGYLQENGINGTYWAAGPWWDTYFMAITPKDGKDRPQMPIIEKYTSTLKNYVQTILHLLYFIHVLYNWNFRPRRPVDRKRHESIQRKLKGKFFRTLPRIQ